MKKNQLIGAGVLGAILGGVLILFLITSGGGISNFGNVSTLSFVENHRALNCEAFNKLGVTKNGVFSTVASGREGFNPVVDSNLLDITQGGVPIESFHIQLWLSCKGDLMKDSSAVTVSGTNNLLLCGDPRNAGTTCLLSDERRFQQINEIASSTTQFNSFSLGTFALPDDTETLIYQGNMRADDLERIFPSGVGDITFTSRMLPQLTLTFNHDTKGIFTATYDGLATNDIVYAQYSGLASNAPPPPDTDGDGFADNVDGCINQAETVNGFQDEDGCPDSIPPDTDGDGVEDALDDCPAELETQNGFQDSDGCPDVVPDQETGEVTQTNDMFKDTDLDGIVDSADLCPFTSEGIQVDADGCTIPEQLEVLDDEPAPDQPLEDIGERRLTQLPPPLDSPISQQTTGFTVAPPTAPSSAPEELALSDIIIFAVIGTVIGVIAIVLIRRRK